jgi:aspartate/methionine/tyrosine aminotransferase
VSKPDRLNETLKQQAPAAYACLSPLGRAAFTPQGIPAQAAQASSCLYKATMGQVTDGHGHAVPLPALAGVLDGLNTEQAFLYSAQGGMPALRQAWGQRIDQRGSSVDRSLPLVTHGLTHGLSLVADLFSQPGTPVLCPFPTWGNYRGLFGLRRGAELRSWNFFSADDDLNVSGFREALAKLDGPAIVLVNLPGNPTGCSPTLGQWNSMCEALVAHPGPLVVVCDDAYNGMVWEPGLLVASPFYDLVRDSDPDRLIAIKIDGATKELGFFGGRIGFLTFGVTGPAADVLEDKTAGLMRASISCLSGPSQAAVISALAHPEIDAQVQSLRDLLKSRYRALRQALPQLDGTCLRPRPFNAGFFALVHVSGQDADELRQKLIREYSVGLIAIRSVNALRIAYGAVDAGDIPELMSRLRASVN